MRVWILNPFDNLPLEGYRPMRFWLMASAFAAAGHEVTYWTADFSHANKAQRKLLADVPPPPFRVVQLHEPPYFRNVSVRRLWSHWRWAKNWTAAVKDEPRPEVIIMSSPPLSIGGEVRKYAARSGAKIVVDVMDDWPGTFERVVPRALLAPLRSIARRNYLAASAITVVSDRYAELVRAYGYTGPINRFYHGIEMNGAPSGTPTAPRPLALLYLGNLGRTYDLTTVIEALTLLPGATLDIAGEGAQLASLKAHAESLPPGRIRFHGYVGSEDLDRLLANSDVGIVPMAPASCVGIPYKFADYSRAGLAIVSSLGGESGKLLARYTAGAAYRGGDPQNLASVLTALQPRLAALKAASRRMAEKEFEAKGIYQAYVKFVRALLVLFLLLLPPSFLSAAPSLSLSPGGLQLPGVPAGQVTTATGVITNEGDEPLILEAVAACCGAQAEVSEQTIAPGGQSVLSVSFTPRQPGEIFKTVSFRTNDPRHPEVQLIVRGQALEPAANATRRWTLPTVLLAGLADGFNPCAFSIVIVLAGLLAASGRQRTDRLLCGIAFCTGSFLTYMLMGLGLMQALKALSGLRIAWRLTMCGLALILSVLALLSFRDALRYHRQRHPKALTLQLPDKVKALIHAIAEKSWSARTSASLLCGIGVTLLDSLCTGQVYVPVLALISCEPGAWRGFFLLAIYNLAFIAPLVMVFILAAGGATAAEMSGWSKRNVIPSKVALGVMFLTLAVLVAFLG